MDTCTNIEICKRDLLKRVKVNKEGPSYVTIRMDLNQIKREEEVYRLNMILGQEVCKCDRCNPYTGNMI